MATNREYKDSVFTKLFSETDKLLELYNALSDENYTSDTKVEINTLEGVLFLDQMNDISFTIGDKTVVLIEHQSSISENLPIRCLMYIARIYEKIVDRKAIYKQLLLKVPAPEFIVLYNGRNSFPDEKELYLSTAFHENPNHVTKFGSLELTVRILNINKGHNESIVKTSDTLHGYVLFIQKVRDYDAVGFDRTTAITKALKYCEKHEILQPFLTEHASEVSNMLYTEFDIDIAKEVWQEEAHETGREEGIEQALSLLESGKSVDEIRQMLKKAKTSQ